MCIGATSLNRRAEILSSDISHKDSKTKYLWIDLSNQRDVISTVCKIINIISNKLLYYPMLRIFLTENL